MEKTLVFKPSRSLIEDTEKRRNRNRVRFVCAPIEFLGVYIMAYSSYQSTGMKFEKYWDLITTQAAGIVLLYACLFAGCIVQFVLCLHCYLRQNRYLQRLTTSYLELSDTELRGLSFDSVDTEPKQFVVPLLQVKSIEICGGTLNVRVHTKDATYACYQLERAQWVAKQIEEAIERCKNA